jgi:hypothetical protein
MRRVTSACVIERYGRVTGHVKTIGMRADSGSAVIGSSLGRSAERRSLHPRRLHVRNRTQPQTGHSGINEWNG